jgi:spore coat polysaccharide biosynthesis predicted glycosyltransferase SpsG/RimJ/RimL family protein N-acetyltransferase
LRILIITESNKKIGYGHFYRCQAIFYSFNALRYPVFLIVNDPSEGNFILNKLELKESSIINYNWNNNFIFDNLLSKEDILVVDSYNIKASTLKSLRNKVKLLVLIDDYSRLNYRSSLVINPSIFFNYPLNTLKTNVVINGKESIIFNEFKSNNYKYNIKKKISIITITLGGSNQEKVIIQILNVLNVLYNKPIINLISNHFNSYKINSFNNLKIYRYYHLNREKFISILQRSDLVITGLGQTVFELLALRIPFIGIQLVDNQKNNYLNLKNILNYKFIISKDNKIISTLPSLIKKIISFRSRSYIYKYFLKFNIKNNTAKIVDKIIKYINNPIIQFKNASKKYIHKIFDLSNQEIVRINSKNPELIIWNEYKRWFNKILLNKNSIYYVLVDNKDNFYGQIRFLRDDISARISLSLSDTLRGKGLSTELLQRSISLFFREAPYSQIISAEISETNIRSIKFFTNCGFKKKYAKDGFLYYYYTRENFYESYES